MASTRSIALLVLLGVFVVSGSLLGQSLSSSGSAGLTTVRWSLSGNTYTWTLTNNSGHSGDGSTDYNLLVWTLQPFRVPKPLNWTAPDGWTWSDNGGHQVFELAQSQQKYTSPAALAPGDSAVFTYTIDPSAPTVNSNGSQPAGLAFLAHTAAVGNAPIVDGQVTRWTPVSAPIFGASWFDASYTVDAPAPVPEHGGLLVLAVATSWVVTCVVKSGRRAVNYKNGRVVRASEQPLLGERVELGLAGSRR
ncbi:MAG: hypothetical protein Q7T82_09590 [Armatimonadota bacterium]|nr:hypothetical protein [Armatimonadota bacterium]